jgi:streptomycin 6-kinase
MRMHGERGTAWLARMPALIRLLEARWGIAVGPSFPGLTHHWVAPATGRAGEDLVLKLGVPGAETTTEIAALRAWNGCESALLINADVAEGALLLERLLPGHTLADRGIERDDDATAVAAELMRLLHAAPSLPRLPSLDEWTRGIVRAAEAGFAPSATGLAMKLRDELLASAPVPVLLHGDLHHFNILEATREPWLAVDPKGIVGDPAYEPAPFLYNPIDTILDAPDPRELLSRRIERFARRLPRQRIVDWAFVYGVLSAWWSFEDDGAGYEQALAVADLLRRR